jgi:hypothetical protein
VKTAKSSAAAPKAVAASAPAARLRRARRLDTHQVHHQSDRRCRDHQRGEAVEHCGEEDGKHDRARDAVSNTRRRPDAVGV